MNITIENGSYFCTNFTETLWDDASIQNANMSNAFMPESKFKRFSVVNTNLEKVDFFKTSLKMCIRDRVNTFCPERNIKLATYASRCIENEILMYLRKSAQLKHEISIDDPLNVDWDGNELLLSDVLGSDPNLVNQNIEKQVERCLLYTSHLCGCYTAVLQISPCYRCRIYCHYPTLQE